MQNAGAPTSPWREKTVALSEVEHVLASSRLKLVTLWGDSRALFSSAEADLFAIDEIVPFDSLVSLLDHKPDLVRYTNEKRLAQTRLLLARAKQSADIEIRG